MPNWKKVIVSGSDAVLNSLNVTNGVTGSLFGTGSWAVRAQSASIADNAVTASRALQSNTASYAVFAATATSATSAGSATSASYATFAATSTTSTNATNATSASYAQFANTASSANDFIVRGSVGIGSISPAFKLEVIGNTRISDKLSIGTTYNGFAANIEGVVYVINGSVWTTDGYGYANASSTSTGMFPDSAHNISFKNNNTTNVYINSNGSIGVGATSLASKLQIGNNTFSSANGFASDNGRLGVMLNGSLTSYVYASTYNDPTYPDYGFVFIHGSGSGAANNTNVWSISPDGPAKGSGLHFIYQSGSTNIHTQTPKVSFIGSSGNIGIGTASPISKLNISAGSGYPLVLDSTQQYLLGLYSSGTAEWWLAVSGGDLKFHENGVGDQIVFKAGGSVGIGTTTVTSGYKLDVVGAARVTGELLVSGSTVTIYNPSNGPAVLNLYTMYGPGPQVWTGRIISDYYGQQYTSSIYHGMSFVGGRASLDHFRWFDSSFAELMTLRATGNLLLGAGTNPAENYWRLYIAGSTSGSIYVASGNSYFGGNIGINTSTLSNRLTINGPRRLDGGTNSIGAAVVAGPISDSPSHGFTNSTAIFRIQGTDATNNLQFGVGNNTYNFHAWIQASFDNSSPGSPASGSKDILMQPIGGNIGIGTNNPTKARLQIEGNVSASSFTGSFLGTIATASHALSVAGGTSNYIPVWGSNNTLSNSIMYQNTNAIGINTTTPTGSNMSSLLHVNGAAAVLRVGPYYSTGGDRDFVEIQANGSDTKVLSPNERFWIQNTGGHILLDASSNIGISTSAPAYKLQTNGGFVDGESEYIATFHSNIGATGDAFIGIGAYRSDTLAAGRKAYINSIAPGGGSGALLLQTTGGNIGINTISPSSKLEIGGIGSSGVADYGAFTLSSGSSGLTFGWDYTNDRSYIYSRNSGVASKPININETMYVLGYGNVGIGITSPSAKLHVSGGSSVQVKIEGTEADLWLTSNGGGAGTWRFLGSTGTTTKRFRLYDNDNARDVFNVYENGNPIFPYGNVGIGTTSPDEKLVVAGAIRVTSNANNWNTVTSGLIDYYSNNLRIVAGAPASTNNGIIFVTTNAGTNLTAMNIKFDGYIGIGTSDPSSSIHLKADTDNSVLRLETNSGQSGVRLMAGSGSTSRATRIDFLNKPASGTVPRWTLINDYNQNATNDFRFVSSDQVTSVLTLVQGGNVGIGTTLPGPRLEVYTTSTSQTAAIKINNSSYTAKGYMGMLFENFYITHGGTYSGAWSADGTNAISAIVLGAGNADSSIAFQTTTTNGAGPNNRMFINKNGLVGINTTSPFSRLTIARAGVSTPSFGDSTNNAHLTLAGDDALVRLQFGTQNVAPYGGWIQASYDNTNNATGSEPLLINPRGGNVGIGTINPATSFHIYGSGGGLELTPGSTTVLEFIDRANVATTVNTSFYTRYGSFAWYKGDYSGVSMYLSGSGNLGLGTSSPVVKFQIGSNTFSGGNGVFDNSRVGAMVNGSLTSYVYASTYNDPSWPDYGFIFIHGPSTSNYNVWSISPDGPARGTGLNFIYGANATNIHTTAPKVTLVGSSGNVGVGTLNPTQKLHVIGPVRASNIAIGTGTYGNIIQAIDDTNLNISASSGIYFINGASANMLLNSAGCLGIGTTAPTYRLEVQGGNIAANGGAIYVRSNPSVSWDFYKISCDGANIFHLLKQASLRIQRNNTTDGGEGSEGEVLYASAVDGNVGIGTISPAYVLDVSGTIRATGDVIAYSDARVKENVKTVEKALDKVNLLRGVTYTRKDSDDKSEKVGVIAQEVLPILPQVVQQDNDGKYNVAYGNMAGLFIEAIKELKVQNDTLQSRIQHLESLLLSK